MSIVDEFQKQLSAKSKHLYASWHKVDLHNHSLSSFDYAGNKATAAKDSADYINTAGLSVVMFTDHGILPSKEFVAEVSKNTNALILRGVELNVFADAFGKPDGKIGREAFFHLLVGFDPSNEHNPEFWLEMLYHQCGKEERCVGGNIITGIPNEINKVIEVLEPANAIIIPAHLHSGSDAWKSRSIDKIYSDARFLEFVPKFTALEVTDLKTAEFFDGKHQETKYLEIACIRSSDAHQADQLGTRPTYVLMQKPSFEELKASLGLRSRVSLVEPIQPDSYALGLHIEGSYHNRIDHTGDKMHSEGQAFEAAEQTLEDLINLVKKLTAANATNILITADHGFIYQHREISESDFLSVEPEGKVVLYRDRRFIIGKNLKPSQSLHTFSSEQLGLKGDVEVQIPKSINRLRLKGSGMVSRSRTLLIH